MGQNISISTKGDEYLVRFTASEEDTTHICQGCKNVHLKAPQVFTITSIMKQGHGTNIPLDDPVVKEIRKTIDEQLAIKHGVCPRCRQH